MVMGSDPRSDAIFAFEHAMAHRQLLSAMLPFDRFSLVPYVLDPQLDNRMWMQKHQNAQDDFITTIPTWGLYPGSLPAYPGTLPVRAGENTNLTDANLKNPGQRTWFTFANWMEHYVGANAWAQVPPGQLFPAW